MNELFIYFLKVNAALVLFYVLFRVAFYRDTFWVGRRIYLILAILVSVLYPLVSLAGWLESREPVQIFIAEWTFAQEFIVTREAVAPTASISWQQILLAVYVAVSAILLVRLFVQLFSIARWNRRSQKAVIHGVSVKTVSGNIAPFSFFKSIYVNPDLCTDEELKEILAHENTHAQQWHSADVILGELLTIACWANPFTWLLKSEIRQNLEFLADNQVVKFGFDTKKYQYYLLNLALYSPDIQLTNKFKSFLKNRIIMMNKSKTKKAGLIKYALILPAIFALIFANSLLLPACSTVDNVVINTKNEVISDAEKLDVMPQFPGGQSALMGFVAENVRYPADAQNDGIQGRVIVQFVVTSDGSIADTEVVRGVHPSLDNEAIRVIEAMPRWIPGEQDGQKVNVMFTMPIIFRLDDASTNTPPSLWVVDGEIMGKDFDPYSVSVENIESITVWGEEEAVARFGERGRNGVVEIVMKR